MVEAIWKFGLSRPECWSPRLVAHSHGMACFLTSIFYRGLKWVKCGHRRHAWYDCGSFLSSTLIQWSSMVSVCSRWARRFCRWSLRTISRWAILKDSWHGSGYRGWLVVSGTVIFGAGLDLRIFSYVFLFWLLLFNRPCNKKKYLLDFFFLIIWYLIACINKINLHLKKINIFY